MDFPHNHPLVRHLWPLGAGASPEDRLAATLRAYQEGTGFSVALPLTAEERKAVRDWLVAEELGSVDETGHGYALLRKKESVSRTLVYPDAATKASCLHQTPCTTCIIDLRRTPLGVSFRIRTRPFSAQALRSRELSKLKAQIAGSMEGRFQDLEAWHDAPLCVRVVAVVAKRDKAKDVDNMVKGLLDALQGSIYVDDTSITHLSVDRLRHEGEQGHYVMSARPVLDPLIDVIDPELRIS